MSSKKGKPIFTYMIIAISVVVMLLATILPSTAMLYDEYALRASNFTHDMRLVSVVTYMFIH